MPEGSVPLLIALVILIILSGFFSSTETAFSCANKIKLLAMSNNGNKLATKVLKLTDENFDKLITTVLVGNNIVNLSSATIATLFFAKILSISSVEVISTAIITIVVLIFGEIIPKFIAKSNPEKTALLYYPVIICFYYLFYPFNFLISGLKCIVSKIFRLKTDDIITEDEILTVVKEAEGDGTLKKEETNLIKSVIEFDDLEVGDILVPRVNIVAVKKDASMEEIFRLFSEEGFSRIPIFCDSIDTIIGTIHEKDFFHSYFNGKKNIDDIIQKAFFTTEHVKISKLLKQLQKKRTHIAIVLDEYGGTLGLVTLEDVIEELVGEIYDEHDEEIHYIKKKNGNDFIIDANMPLADFFETFNLKGDGELFDALTLSGWIIENLGEIPVVGKTFEYKNLFILITKSTVKRILEIKVTKN